MARKESNKQAIEPAHLGRAMIRAAGLVGTGLLLFGGVVVGRTSHAQSPQGPGAPRHPLPDRAIWNQITFSPNVLSVEDACKNDPTKPPGSVVVTPECVCEGASTKSGGNLTPKQTAQCVEAESEHMAQRQCGFIESEKDFYACACSIFRVFRPNNIATPLRPDEMTQCVQRAARAQPVTGPRPASVQVNVLAARIDFPCSLFADAIDRHPTFDGTLEWNDNGVRLGSDTFSCSLVGPPAQMVGSADCNFMVGGGNARTPAVCRAARINGQRVGDSLHLTASDCSGRYKTICGISADIDAMVTPK